MSFQFLRTETHALKVSAVRRTYEAERYASGTATNRALSAEEICNEGARVPGFHPHVTYPGVPNIVFGVSPALIPAILQAKVDTANERIRAAKKLLPRGERSSGPRAIRTDAHVLTTTIGSHPFLVTADESGKPSLDDQGNRLVYEAWRQAWIAEALIDAERRGQSVLSIVEHLDERFVHLHAYSIPDNDRCDARACHPGLSAKANLVMLEGEETIDFKKRQNKLYQKKMAEWQDQHYDAVSSKHGLLRYGPKRQRLTRDQYQTSVKAAAANGMLQQNLAKLRAEVTVEQDAITQLAKVRENEAEVQLRVVVEERHNLEKLNRERDEAERVFAEQRERNRIQDEAFCQLKVSVGGELLEVGKRRRDEEARLAELVKASAEQASVLTTARADTERLLILSSEAASAKARAELAVTAATKYAEAVTLASEQAAGKLAEREELLSAKELGLHAWAEGRLKISDDADHPSGVSFRFDGNALKDAAFIAKMVLVRAWLAEHLAPLERNHKKLLDDKWRDLHEAVTASVKAWRGGTLKRVESNPDTGGKSRLVVTNTAAGNILLRQIKNHKPLIAAIISALPERKAFFDLLRQVNEIKTGLDAVAAKKLARMRAYAWSQMMGSADEDTHVGKPTAQPKDLQRGNDLSR